MIHSKLQSDPDLSAHGLQPEIVKVELSKNSLLQAIEAFSMGLIRIDANCKIVYWNFAAEKLTGYAQQQVLHRNLFNVITEIDHIGFRRKWQHILKHKKSVEFRDYYWPTQRWFKFCVYADGNDTIVQFEDITKTFATKRKLYNKINQLREVSIFNSHIIRRPLANLIGLTNLLDEDINVEDVKEYVSYINKSAKNLESIISKLNAIANDDTDNDSGAVLVHFRFKDLLNEIKNEIVDKGTENLLTIRCANILFYGNKSGISRSIRRLIINAIAHADRTKPIRVNVSLKKNNIYVQVQDDGDGMSEQTLLEIHTALTSGKPSDDHRKYIEISHLCQEHNGSFWIDSTINKGTSRTLLFPMSNFSASRPNHRKNTENKNYAEVLIDYRSAEQCLHVKWNGYFDSSNQKKNIYKIYEALKTHQCTKVVSDETNSIGSGIHSIKWLVNYGFPLLRKAGLSRFAWITSKNEFGKLSAISASRNLNKQHTIKLFHQQTPAFKWINKEG
jgi:signal transduction histidine kinase